MTAMTTEQILTSKLSIPIHPDLFISPRLSGILETLTQKRLAVICAGAGHGKTALTAWAVRQKEITPVWYHLDEQDRDFSRFVRYAAAGLTPLIQNPSPMLEGLIAGAPLSAVHRGRALAALAHALETAPGTRVCLVLDDFHTVQQEKAILESVTFLVDNLPPWFHIILLTRAAPEIDLSRLQLTGQAVDITESDLLFTLDETRQFLTTHLNPPLPLELADQVHQISKGWAAGLVLFYLGLKDLSPEGIAALPPDLAGSNKLIFNYFEQAVFHSLAPETREFMLKTSLLDTLEPEFCNALLHITGSEKILNQLVDGHLFTYRKEFGQNNHRLYTYHHLLRSFLRTLMKQTLPRETITGLYLDIAHLQEAAGNAVNPSFR